MCRDVVMAGILAQTDSCCSIVWTRLSTYAYQTIKAAPIYLRSSIDDIDHTTLIYKYSRVIHAIHIQYLLFCCILSEKHKLLMSVFDSCRSHSIRSQRLTFGICVLQGS
jgi:hypothetical protein